MTKFRVRKWLSLHQQKEIVITAETYKHISKYGFIKTIFTGSNNGWLIAVQPEVFEMIEYPYDKASLAHLIQDFIETCRQDYLSKRFHMKHPLHRHTCYSMRKRNKRRV